MRFFPFSAIVGQEEMKTALLICAVAPEVGGVLIFGKKGTAKSSAVRALPGVLPEIEGVADCHFFCPPDNPREMCRECLARQNAGETLPVGRRPRRVVTLPLNASEERVVGFFDLERVLHTGEKAFSPGLLAEANRNLLYIDEVNLLNDHLIDILLDAAALGTNFVEREGLSFSHPSRFILVGTMNPEEGELRPQFLDRFGLSVMINDLRKIEDRVTVLERAAANEEDHASFLQQYAAQEAILREKVAQAQRLYPQVKTSLQLRYAVSKKVREMRADGHRGDIVINAAARALAALDGRTEVTLDDAERALRLAMAHRAKELGPQRQGVKVLNPEEALTGGAESPDKPTELAEIEDFEMPEESADENFQAGMAGISRKIRQGEEAFSLNQILKLNRDRKTRHESGKRYLTKTDRTTGRYVRSRLITPVTDLAFDATLRAAALHQRRRGWEPGQGARLELRAQDLRQKMRERKSRALIVFLIDASDSVMSRDRMTATKRAVLALLQDAYQKRDRVALITFRFSQARVVLPPTNNMTKARESLERIYVGGCTPIATGLMEGLNLIERERRRDASLYPVIVLFTDGEPNVGLNGNMRGAAPVNDTLEVADTIGREHIASVVIDTGRNYGARRANAAGQTPGLCQEMADRMGGSHFALAELKRQTIFERA
jgi:magnesium chelatase subunit D